MYIPDHFREDDRSTLVAFMRANSFAILVTTLDGSPIATHLPLVVEVAGEALVLRGHVAKANPQWRTFASAEALVIFHGPHAYISPANYESKHSVPTWNYIAVHAYGVPRIIEAKEAMLEAMIAQYEPAHQAQWESQNQKYKQGMLGGIVAFELAVTRLEGKAKLSQNRPEGDQCRVIESLGQSDDPAVSGIAKAMLERRTKD